MNLSKHIRKQPQNTQINSVDVDVIRILGRAVLITFWVIILLSPACICHQTRLSLNVDTYIFPMQKHRGFPYAKSERLTK